MKGQERSTAKNQSPRHNYLVWGELGLAAWRALGRYEAVLLFCILYYGRVMCNGMVCYCLPSCLPSECRVPSTLSSALYDLLRINANGSQPSQVLIQYSVQADFSVPARMTADKGGGKRADMTVEWKGVALEKCTVDPFSSFNHCTETWRGWPDFLVWCQTGWYRGRGGGQIGYLVSDVVFYVVFRTS